MKTSFQILISVSVSPLTEAPLISDSPFHSTTLPQSQTGWVLSEAHRTYSGGCRYREAEGTTLLEKIQGRHEQYLPTLMLESVTSISFDLPQEHEWTGHLLPSFICNLLISFIKKKKALGIARNIWTNLTSSLILTGSSCLVQAQKSERARLCFSLSVMRRVFLSRLTLLLFYPCSVESLIEHGKNRKWDLWKK